MAEIPLTRGMVAIVDEEDFEQIKDLSEKKWQATRIDRGGKNKLYYAKRGGGQRALPLIYMHQLLLDVPKDKEVDHIDGNGLNNRRSNLRICYHPQNCFNRRKQFNTSSIYKGVYWNKQRHKWQAQIKFEGRRHFLGRFTNEVQAALAYNKAAKKEYGEFATLNKIK